VTTIYTGFFLSLTIGICRVVFLRYDGSDKLHEHIKLESWQTTEGETSIWQMLQWRVWSKTLWLKPANRKYTVLLSYVIVHYGRWLPTIRINILPFFQYINKLCWGYVYLYCVQRRISTNTANRNRRNTTAASLKHNNNNIYLLQLGFRPGAVVILHVNKTWNWLLLNLSRQGYMRSM